ncbi:AAA family ATPase [Streptomyces sp. NPDC058572]|uniref:AAA family ATPase n=1 Tax=Streptomyces sp. NPDC058572 TaxID=3346546 RepID=UPI00364F58F1
MTEKSGYGSVRTWGGPDRGDGTCYLMPDEGRLAVEVALATGRPLLLRGKPGCGKSSLAMHVAHELDWRYYEHVVTYRTQASDLLWTYDTVRRLADAQARANGGDELDDHRYVRPGPLWWAYARDSALRRGAPRDLAVHGAAAGNGGPQDTCEEPFVKLNESRSRDGAVVLIDEIDKADPDVPNGLLVPLGSGKFRVTETGTVVRMEQRTEPGPAPARHLVVITTNEERELPQAFLRRCVVASLPSPGKDRLVEIARAHLTDEFWDRDQEALATAVAREVLAAREQADKDGMRAPSTAEFLDALHACLSLEIRSPADPRWTRLRNLVLLKHQQPEDAAEGDGGR